MTLAQLKMALREVKLDVRRGKRRLRDADPICKELEIKIREKEND